MEIEALRSGGGNPEVEALSSAAASPSSSSTDGEEGGEGGGDEQEDNADRLLRALRHAFENDHSDW